MHCTVVGVCVCLSVWACVTMKVLHIVQGMYVGNTVCTPRTDEREEVGGQEVKNKRNTSSDLSDGYRLG